MCDLLTATLEIFGHFTARLGRRTASPRTAISVISALASRPSCLRQLGGRSARTAISVISPLASAVGRPRLALRSSPAIPVALEGEVDEAVDERDVVEARRLPHARVAAGRGEAGDGVDLVQEQTAVVLEEEVDARHAGAVDGLEGRHTQFLHPPGQLGPDGRRNHELGLALGVLRRVVVPLGAVADLGRQRGHRLVVAEDADLDFAPDGRALDQDLPVVPRGLVDRRGEIVDLPHLADTHARAEVRRLDEARDADALRDSPGDAGTISAPLVTHDDLVLDHRQAMSLKDGLHRDLVHPDRRGQHAGAHVREVGQLEEPLDRAVFTIRTVQHDHNDVQALTETRGQAACRLDADQRGVSRGLGLGTVGERLFHGSGVVVRKGDAGLIGQSTERVAADDPASIARDPERHDPVTAALESGDDRRRRGEPDFVLAGAAAEDDADAKRRHEIDSSRRRRADRRSQRLCGDLPGSVRTKPTAVNGLPFSAVPNTVTTSPGRMSLAIVPSNRDTSMSTCWPSSRRMTSVWPDTDCTVPRTRSHGRLVDGAGGAVESVRGDAAASLGTGGAALVLGGSLETAAASGPSAVAVSS